MATARSEFRNTKDHVMGVVVRGPNDKMAGIALNPGDTVWMDEDEQMATANAPREAGDNPFINGDLELVTPATMVANRRPIGYTEHPQVPSGEAPQPPEGDAPKTESAESGPAGDGGTPVEGSQEPGAGEGGAGSDDGPPAAPKVPQAAPEPPGDPAETKRALTAQEEEENARQAAARAVKGGAPRQANETGAAPKAAPAKPVEGSRAAGEEIATPGALGK